MQATEADLSDLDSAVADLCRLHVTPEYIVACDRQSRFPVEAMKALADAGYAAMAVPVEHGGAGASAVELAIVHMALARHSLAVAQAFYSLWVLGAMAIARLGSEEQLSKWLPRIASGNAYAAFALTEPDSGSDASALRTSASLRDTSYLVRGQKLFVTGAAIADVIITAVRTEPQLPKHEGISLILVDPHAPGVQIRKVEKIGLHMIDLCEVFFDDVAVSTGCLLGPKGKGWANLRQGLAAERTLLAAISTGALEHLIALSADHARTRTAFGRPLGTFQMVAEKIVNMRVAARAARLLTRSAAAAIDNGEPAVVEAAIAKLFASESYVSATREAVQVFGGYGFTEEYAVGRHYRDAKYLEIGGGSSEIQRMIIGRDMGLM